MLNSVPKHVVSSTLDGVDWDGASLLDGDPIDPIGRLKDTGDGELQVHGCAQLARSLLDAGLVDEVRLLTFPVVVGQGKRLFGPDSPPSGFRCVEARALANGSTYVALEPQPFTAGEFVVVDGHEAVA